MTPLVTIMIMFVGEGGTYAAQFNSQHECGRALLEFSAIADELEREYGGEAWARCLVTGAPSVSIRPKARGVRV